MEKLIFFLSNLTNIPYAIVRGESRGSTEIYTVEFGAMRIRVTLTVDKDADKVFFNYMGSLLDLRIPNNAILFNDYVQLRENLID